MSQGERLEVWEIGFMFGNAEIGFTQEIYCGGDSWIYVKRPFAAEAAAQAFALIKDHDTFSSRPAPIVGSEEVREALVDEAWLRTVEARHAESEAFMTSRGKEAPDCHRDRASLLATVRRLLGQWGA